MKKKIKSIKITKSHWAYLEKMRKDFKKNHTDTTKYPGIEEIEWK